MARVRNPRYSDLGAAMPPPQRRVPDAATPAPADDACVDELLEWIESSEPDARFVPDLSGESYKNAA